MEPTFLLSPNMTKAERYEAFIPQWKAFIDGETDVISILANTSAALKEAFGFFWIGFYIVKDGELHVGPFQGSAACYRIKKGKGVCGTAWKEATTQVVPDVELFQHYHLFLIHLLNILKQILANVFYNLQFLIIYKNPIHFES